jgi:hypothetical protein
LWQKTTVRLAGSTPTRVGRSQKNLVEGEVDDLPGAGVVERLEDLFGLLGLVVDPATDRRVVGAASRPEQGLEGDLDLTRGDAGGEGDGGHLAELGRIAEDRPLELSFDGGELLAKPLILGDEFGVGLGVGFESLFDQESVLVDGLAAASGLLGLASDGAVDTGEDGGGVADPGADR